MNFDVLIGMEHVLFKRDVCWLIQQCPEGRTISSLCSPFFLDLIDDEEPIVVKRMHFETTQWGDERCVLTAVFPQLTSGIPLLNEIVCHAEHFQRVCKIAAIEEDRVMSDEEWAEQQKRRVELEGEQKVEGSPWEEDTSEWGRLLGGG